MGGQIAEEFRDWFEPVLEQYAPWLVRDLEKFRPAICRLRRTVRNHLPHLEFETEGMAEALGWDCDLTLGLRFFNEIHAYHNAGCSGIFLAQSDRGPLLARTCDLEPDISADIQLCRINRPNAGPATILVTYLPLTGGVGFNEFGLALTGASASTKGAPDPDGIPAAIFNQLLITKCRTLDDVAELAKRNTLRGKGLIEIVCDDRGGSMILELAPGRQTILTTRRPDRDWQAVTNFCQTPGLEPVGGADYLSNAYARYGRIVHQLEDGGCDRTFDSLKNLVLEISQPGLVCHEPLCSFRTVYAFIAEPRARKMRLCPGHPSQTDYVEISL